MILRPYQSAAVHAVYDHLRTRTDNPCVVIPTGGGKTPVLATICRDATQRWDARVCVLAHVKELLEQSIERIRAVDAAIPVGVYSASLGARDTGYAVTVAGIQSVYQRASSLGPLDLIIVDEAHLIPPDGEGMYRQFVADAKTVNPHVRVLGLTATPYRMRSGMICEPDGILNHVCYEVGVRDLMDQGYLCRVRAKRGESIADVSEVTVRGGEFVAEALEAAMDQDGLVESAIDEIVGRAIDRSSVLIFCAGVAHAQHVVNALAERHGAECGFVAGFTPPSERAETIRRFRDGSLKYLANVNVLTTGFDAPNVDVVVMLRPTMSPGLYYQMVGRGFRTSPGKADCLILDYGDNIIRHGPVDTLTGSVRKPGAKMGPMARCCPQCRELVPVSSRACPVCGTVLIVEQEAAHAACAADAPVVSSEDDAPVDTEYPVQGVGYYVHHKKKTPDAPPTMRVEYRVGLSQWIKEWVCFEHAGYARNKACKWWFDRSGKENFPETVQSAVDRARDELATPVRITARHQRGEMDRVIRVVLPASVPPVAAEIPQDELPF